MILQSCRPSRNNTPLTTFHRSLTNESTLRMSACSAPPLIPTAGPGRCLHCSAPFAQQPQTGTGIRSGMRNPKQTEGQR